MNLLDKLRAAVAPKHLFNDKVKVHTTDSGTQYIEPRDLFNDKDWVAQMRQLDRLARKAQEGATESVSSDAHPFD